MKCAPYLCATLVVAFSAAWTIAQECCVSCGCNTCIRKVCHVKCETKKVPHTEYCCECEDFCVPGEREHPHTALVRCRDDAHLRGGVCAARRGRCPAAEPT